MSFTQKIALITGSAGFIGYHLSKYLLARDWQIIGIDNLNNYYDTNLKIERNKLLSVYHNYNFFKFSIEDSDQLKNIFHEYKPNLIIHLAAQAGVRHSIKDPRSYLDTNITGTFNILQLSSELKIDHFLFASTSSVYGFNKKVEMKEKDNTNFPASFYSATKKSNEVMLHSFSHLFKIPTTILRFFTVYGPYGRPDMSLFSFTKSILTDKPIKIYNNGEMYRDFTFVDDVVKCLHKLIYVIPKVSQKNEKKYKNDTLSSYAPYRIVNIGNSNPIKLTDYIRELEFVLGKKSSKIFLEMHPGDIPNTFSSNTLLKELTKYEPNTDLKVGISKFVDWYKYFYKI